MTEKKNEALAKEVRENASSFYEKWRKNIDNYNYMTAFTMGEQWNEEEKAAFKGRRKKRLTFNKLYPIVNNVIGEYIQMTPAMEVVPITADARNIEKDIEVIKDLFKSIAYSSDAKNQYRLAAKTAARGGYGALKVYTEYKDAESFDQVIKVKAFSDPTTCFFDINAKSQSKTDGMYCGYYTVMSRKAFERKYSKAQLKSGSHDCIRALNKAWYDDDSVMIVHYYKKDVKKDVLCFVQGSGIIEDGNYFESELKKLVDEEQFKLLSIVNKRDTEKVAVKYYKVAGNYVLEETEIYCDELPLIYVDQESYEINGEQKTRAIVQDAHDSQKFANFLGSQIAHLIKLQRNDQFIGTKIMTKDNEEVWRDPSNRQGILHVTPDPMFPGAIPHQLEPIPINPGLMEQYQRSINDIHTSTGVFPTQIGNTGNEISGAAIRQRAEQASMSNIAFFVNVNTAIATAGRICLKMMPKYYDAYRVEAMQTSSGGTKAVEINKPDGYRIINNVKAAKFMLSVDANLSLEGQKRQALESLQMVLQSNPAMFNLIADLFAENLPLSNSIQISNRLKTIVPKEVIAAGNGEEIPPAPPQPSPQEQLMQMKMQVEQGKLQNQQAQNQVKMEEIQLGRERLKQEAMETFTQAEIEHLRAFSQILSKMISNPVQDMGQSAQSANMVESLIKRQEQPSPAQELLRGVYE